jgi:MYXO-CTERM domain-containing protein
MPTDAVTLLPWLMLALLGLAALAAWLRRRNGSSNLPEEVVVGNPPPAQPDHMLRHQSGRRRQE